MTAKAWKLANAEEREGVSFEIPTRLEREQLSVGAVVKLVFVVVPPPPRPPNGERMWVRIIGFERPKRGAAAAYIGRLENEPVVIAGLSWGDEIIFGPEHICEISYRGTEGN